MRLRWCAVELIQRAIASRIPLARPPELCRSRSAASALQVGANKRVAAVLGRHDKSLQAKYEATVDEEVKRFKKAYELVNS